MAIFRVLRVPMEKASENKKLRKILKFTSRTSSVAPLGNGRGKSCEATRGRGFPYDRGKFERSDEGGESEANGVYYVDVI